MDFVKPTIEYGQLAPLFVIFGVACLGVLVEAFIPRRSRFLVQATLSLGGIVLTLAVLVSEMILLFLLLLPLLLVARVLWVLPWVIEATYGDEILGVDKVRGWRASSDRIREIAASYERGDNPF